MGGFSFALYGPKETLPVFHTLKSEKLFLDEIFLDTNHQSLYGSGSVILELPRTFLIHGVAFEVYALETVTMAAQPISEHKRIAPYYSTEITIVPNAKWGTSV